MSAYQQCDWCNLYFWPVSWLEWRVNGYCQEKCQKDYLKSTGIDMDVKMPEKVKCDYCGDAAHLVGGNVIYPHRNDLHGKKFWQCGPCEAWVGCHPGTEIPLGRLADAELRLWKQKAHAAFDPIWKARHKRKNAVDKKYTTAMARGGRYAALADALGIPRAHCHIGMMDVETCRRVVEVCEKGGIES